MLAINKKNGKYIVVDTETSEIKAECESLISAVLVIAMDEADDYHADVLQFDLSVCNN